MADRIEYFRYSTLSPGKTDQIAITVQASMRKARTFMKANPVYTRADIYQGSQKVTVGGGMSIGPMNHASLG